MKIKNLLIGIVTVILLGCNYGEITCKDTVHRTIINKTIDTGSNGKTLYKLAFNDGYTKIVSFGTYSCVKEGGTVSFTICHQYGNGRTDIDYGCN